MADTQAGASKASDDMQDAMKKQIAELRREITKINRTLSAQAEDAAETAQGWYESAADKASRATQNLRSQAQTVVGHSPAEPRYDIVGDGPWRHAGGSRRHRHCQKLGARAPLVLEPAPSRWYRDGALVLF